MPRANPRRRRRTFLSRQRCPHAAGARPALRHPRGGVLPGWRSRRHRPACAQGWLRACSASCSVANRSRILFVSVIRGRSFLVRPPGRSPSGEHARQQRLDAGLRHVQALDGGGQALVDGVLALHEPFDPLIHPMLRLQHPGQSCHNGFMLSKALLRRVVCHHSRPSRLPGRSGNTATAACHCVQWSHHGPDLYPFHHIIHIVVAKVSRKCPDTLVVQESDADFQAPWGHPPGKSDSTGFSGKISNP